MLEVRITGSAGLAKLAEQIRTEGNKGLGREMASALRRASEPVQRSIREEYLGLPVAGGYAGVFSKSLRFRTSQRTQSRNASYRLLTFADGGKERRDIVALEGGKLRHPVFGRSRAGRRKGERHANPWAVTTVRGDFHRRGTDHAADAAEKQMAKVLDDFAAKLIS